VLYLKAMHYCFQFNTFVVSV